MGTDCFLPLSPLKAMRTLRKMAKRTRTLIWPKHDGIVHQTFEQLYQQAFYGNEWPEDPIHQRLYI